MNVELRTLNSAQQILFSWIEEIEAANLSTMICFCFGQLLQSMASIRVIIERGEEFKVATVTAGKNLAQINDAVNGFFKRGKFPCFGTIPVFNLAVVFKKGNVIGCFSMRNTRLNLSYARVRRAHHKTENCIAAYKIKHIQES